MDRQQAEMIPLKEIIEQNDSKLSRVFELFVQTLIVLSLIASSLETLPDLSREWLRVLMLFEGFSVSIFTVEYLLRAYVSTPRRKYVLSFFGLVDLVAILPFYLGMGGDLLSIRLFRLLRLIRVFKLVRYSSAVRRFHLALIIAKEELVLFGCVTAILLYVSAVGIYHFENEAQPDKFASVFHSLWWSVTTLTTVGYGDVFPITLGGRIFTFFVLMIGLGVISIPAGLLASALSRARQMEEEAKKIVNAAEEASVTKTP